MSALCSASSLGVRRRASFVAGTLDRRRESQRQTGLTFSVAEFGEVLEASEQFVPHFKASDTHSALRPGESGPKRSAPVRTSTLAEPPQRVGFAALIGRLAAQRQRSLEPQFGLGEIATRERKLSEPQLALSFGLLILDLARYRQRLLEVYFAASGRRRGTRRPDRGEPARSVRRVGGRSPERSAAPHVRLQRLQPHRRCAA